MTALRYIAQHWPVVLLVHAQAHMLRSYVTRIIGIDNSLLVYETKSTKS